MSALTLTPREQMILSAVIKQMENVPAVDFKAVAVETGHVHPKNARSAFLLIWNKLKGSGSGKDTAAKAAPKKQTVAKAAAKTAVARKKGVDAKMRVQKAKQAFKEIVKDDSEDNESGDEGNKETDDENADGATENTDDERWVFEHRDDEMDEDNEEWLYDHRGQEMESDNENLLGEQYYAH